MVVLKICRCVSPGSTSRPSTRRSCTLRPPRSARTGLGHNCRFAPPLIHFIPDSLRYSVSLLLNRQCGRAPGKDESASRLMGVVVGAPGLPAAIAQNLQSPSRQAPTAAFLKLLVERGSNMR
jgi:hypothetical protein